MFLYYIGILFLAFFLIVMLKRTVSLQKRMNHARNYGQLTFDIDLPESVSHKIVDEIKKVDNINRCSQEEFFFMFVTPQLGRLPQEKRMALKDAADQLKSEIKMYKSIYQAFIDEYKKYEGLSDDEATEKWLMKEEKQSA